MSDIVKTSVDNMIEVVDHVTQAALDGLTAVEDAASGVVDLAQNTVTGGMGELEDLRASFMSALRKAAAGITEPLP